MVVANDELEQSPANQDFFTISFSETQSDLYRISFWNFSL